MMVGGQSYASSVGSGRPWTFYALATLFGVFLLFLYGPMLVMYVLSFQGPHGGVTFPMVGFSTVWFADILQSRRECTPSKRWESAPERTRLS